MIGTDFKMIKSQEHNRQIDLLFDDLNNMHVSDNDIDDYLFEEDMAFYDEIRSSYIKESTYDENKTLLKREKDIMKREEDITKREQNITKREQDANKLDKIMTKRERIVKERDRIINEKLIIKKEQEFGSVSELVFIPSTKSILKRKNNDINTNETKKVKFANNPYTARKNAIKKWKIKKENNIIINDFYPKKSASSILKSRKLGKFVSSGIKWIPITELQSDIK